MWGIAVSCLSLSPLERSALAKVAERPRPFGEIDANHVGELIDHGLVETELGHYLITPKGQLERQRQVFRSVATAGKRAHVDGRSFLFLQESRFEDEDVPRGRIREWLRARGLTRVEEVETVSPPAATDPDAESAAGLMDRLRAFVGSSDDAGAVETQAEQEQKAMAQLLPVSFYDDVNEQTAKAAEMDFIPKRMAQTG